MHVFILGGTGTIGSAILSALQDGPHRVSALSRSTVSDERLRQLGATPLRGDLRRPTDWIAAALTADAIIHTAATFEDDMAMVDDRLVTALLDHARGRTRLLYTGGCWLYGDTGGAIATETSRFDPIPAFDWMLRNSARLLDSPAFATAILHPAMVYTDTGGAFDRFLAAARAGQPVELWGSAETRWPLIHAADLARAYIALLDRPDLTGHFNAVAEAGVPVGDIARTLTNRPPIVLPRAEALARHGDWALGPMLDQVLSADKLRADTGWSPRFTDYRQVFGQKQENGGP